MLMLATVSAAAQCHGDDGALSQPLPLTSRVISPDSIIQRIAFASCYVPQFEEPGVWMSIAGQRPDLLLLMGDNVYQTEEKAEPELLELREAYSQLAGEEEFAALRRTAGTFATWDDHDYGRNDAGADLPVRYQSERLFEQVWPLPQKGDDRRKSRDGIYYATVVGPVGKRLQLILLDTRFFRGPLDGSASSSMLGEAQWQWLANELQKPAELRLLVSSIPVLSDRNDAENWGRLPAERGRLIKLVNGTNGVLILSGDSHYAAFYQDDDSPDHVVTEFTASSLNFPYPEERRAAILDSDSIRQGTPFFDANYGWLEIDWAAMRVRAAIYSDKGELAMQEYIDLDKL